MRGFDGSPALLWASRLEPAVARWTWQGIGCGQLQWLPHSIEPRGLRLHARGLAHRAADDGQSRCSCAGGPGGAAQGILDQELPEKGKPAGVVIPGPVEISFKEWQAPTSGSRPHDPLAARDGSL